MATALGTLTTLAFGAAFGLALAAPPGPMNAVIAEESVLGGWSAGFRAGLGAATADLCFFVLAALGAVTFVDHVPLVRALMIAVGGVLMLYFAYGAATDARDSFRAKGGTPGDTSHATADAAASGGGAVDGERKGFRKAFVLALTNPYQILFWLTVGVGLLQPGRVDVLSYASEALAGVLVVRTGSPALLVGLFGGVGVWITGFPAALNAAERRTNALAPSVASVSAVVLAGFGVYYLYDALRTLS